MRRLLASLDDSKINIKKNQIETQGGNDPNGYLGLGLWESGSHAKGNLQPHRQYVAENQIFSIKLSIFRKVRLSRTSEFTRRINRMRHGIGLGGRARRALVRSR